MAGIDSYTKLLLHCNGSDASTTFTDSEITPKTMTANGNAQIDTAQSKFGGASGLFDGTGDTVTTGDNADWDFGTGAFTIDFWVRFNSVAQARLLEIGNKGTIGIGIMYETPPSGIHLVINGTTITFSTWTPSANTWYHVAVVRSGSSLYVFIDGTQLGSTETNSADISGSTEGFICGGWNSITTQNLNGWLDEVRVSKGIARWTGNFTPETAEYSLDVSYASYHKGGSSQVPLQDVTRGRILI